MVHGDAEVIRVDVQPAVLRGAYERARLDPAVLAMRMPQLVARVNGEERPTSLQLEAAAGPPTRRSAGAQMQEPTHEPLPI